MNCLGVEYSMENKCSCICWPLEGENTLEKDCSHYFSDLQTINKGGKNILFVSEMLYWINQIKSTFQCQLEILAKVKGWECACQICSDACGLCLLKCQLDDLTAVEVAMKRLTLRTILHAGKITTPSTNKLLSEAVVWFCTGYFCSPIFNAIGFML